MTPEVLAALRRIVDELGADAGVLLRLTPSGACFVTSSTLVPALGVDDAWGFVGSLSGSDFGPELVVDPDRLAQLVPAGVLRALAVEPTATLVAPVEGAALRIVLLWSASPPPVDVTSAMESESMRRFTALAPLLDAQVRARESSIRLRAVASALDQAVVVTVAGDVLANINAAAARLLDLPPGPVDGITLATAMRALRERAVDPDGLGVEVARLRESATAVAHDWVWHLNGSPSHLRVTSVPVDTTTEEGRVWVFDDISAEMELLESEQRANRALAESEERYRLLAENVSDVVMLGTADGTITWVSPSVTAALGWAPEDLVGRRGIDSVRPETVDSLHAMQERSIRGEIAEFEAPMRTATGTDRWMHVRAKPVFDDDGRVVGRVVGLWDVQAAHDAKDELERQEQRANRALAESEARYRLLSESVSDVVALFNLEGVVTWVSPSVTAVLGWAPDDLVGHTTRHLVHPDHREGAAAYRDPLLRGERVEYEVQIRTAGGDYRWMEVRATPFDDEHGSPAGVVVGWWDVQAVHDAKEEFERSERRSARALAASEERYRLLAENVADVVVQTDVEGVLTWVSPSVTEILGWAPDDLVGRTAQHLVDAEQYEAALAKRERLLRGERVEYEVPMRTAWGDQRWMNIRATLLRDEHGDPAGFIGGWWDVQAVHDAREQLELSERRAAEALLESEERYRLLAENISDVAVLFDVEGVVTWVSPSVTDHLGWAPHDLVGRTTQHLVNPDHWEGAMAHQEQLLAGERVDFEVQLRTAGGDYRWVDVRATPIQDEQGRPAGLLAAWWDNQAVHDVREAVEHNEQRAVEALAESEARYRLLAENISDIVIMGSADGTVTWASPSIAVTLGWAPEDMVGRLVPEFVRADHLEVLHRAMEQVERGESATFDAPILTSGGDYRWMEVRGRLLYDDDGRVIGRVAALWDVQAAHDAKDELERSEKRSARALVESDQRYRLLAENVSDIVMMGTVDGILTWVSPSVTATLGWAPDDILGTRFPDFVRPDHLELMQGALERVSQGDRVTFELPIRTAAGEHRWMEVRVKLLYDDGGRVVGRLAALWDVQAAHEAKEELERSERRYRLLLENTTEVVFQTVDGVVTWVSPAIEAVTGWHPADIIGTSSRQLWHPDDWARASWAHDDARDGVPAREVLRLITPDGSHRWMEVVIRPYVEEDGTPGTVGMVFDVSDREVARESARQSEDRYRMVAEHASDVVCRYRADGTIEWVFGSTEKFLGRTAEELVGTPLLQCFVVEDWGDRDDIRARLGRGEAVQLVARLRHVDGSTRWVEVRAEAVLGPDGSLGSIIGTMRDAQAEVDYQEALAASERQARELVDAFEEARDEAIRASTAKTAFLSRMSHELRTPLNAVLGFAQLLALDPLTPEQGEAVHHIRHGGRHLLDLINEIVDISRIEAGRLSLTMQTVDSAAVLAQAVEMVGGLAQQYDVKVVAKGARQHLPHVYADQQRVTQVLLNLTSNAVKYNRPGGSVRVRCRRGAQGEVRFEVYDTGPGIPDELLPRLFEPFDRLGAENSDVEGTGIGLALADALARAMGGRIEVSTKVGVGSTFTLVLRAAPTMPSRVEPVEPETDAQHGSRLGILYVEDNPTNATLMERVVALRPGCRLRLAVNGADGLAALESEPADLVFLDVHLPDLSGAEVLQRLRLLPGCADVPVVVVTADASPSVRERMASLGSDGFLTKPLDLSDVLGWIDDTAASRPVH